MAITKFGDKTKSIYLNEAESHKLHLAFEVAAGQTIHRGQPVILNADGQITVPATNGSNAQTIIGYSIHNAAAGEECTIAMRAYAVIYAMSSGAFNAGPALYAGVNGTDADYMNYNTADATTMNGWALDKPTGANQLIRIAVR